MATLPIHVLATVTLPYVYNIGNMDFGIGAAAKACTNDAMRFYIPDRKLGHFTLNPNTGEVSWMTFPSIPVKKWDKETLMSVPKFDAGKPGNALVDEATIPAEFWRYNKLSEQNMYFYLHLVQDKSFDRFIRSFLDVYDRYNGIYYWNGEKLSGAQVRGEEMERWSNGIIPELTDQFFVRLAAVYFKATGIKPDDVWISNEVKPAILECYSPELANNTVKFLTISAKAAYLIKNEKFDDEVWLVPNRDVDQHIDWMLEDMFNAVVELETKLVA